MQGLTAKELPLLQHHLDTHVRQEPLEGIRVRTEITLKIVRDARLASMLALLEYEKLQGRRDVCIRESR